MSALVLVAPPWMQGGGQATTRGSSANRCLRLAAPRAGVAAAAHHAHGRQRHQKQREPMAAQHVIAALHILEGHRSGVAVVCRAAGKGGARKRLRDGRWLAAGGAAPMPDRVACLAAHRLARRFQGLPMPCWGPRPAAEGEGRRPMAVPVALAGPSHLGRSRSLSYRWSLESCEAP